MKFRVKGSAFSTPYILELESNDATVLDLKKNVGDRLMLQEEDLKLLQLSMNGKVALPAEDSQTIVSLGFVSGDIIHILGTPAGVQAPLQEKKPGPPKEPEIQTVASEMETGDAEAACSSKSLSETVGMKEETKVYLSLSEMDTLQSSNLVERLVASNPDKMRTTFEQFSGLLHILMIEVGFVPITAQEEGFYPHLQLPDSWNIRHETLKLNYASSYPPHAQCTIVITSMGPLAIVYGQTSLEKSKVTWKTKPSEFLCPELQNLSKLSVEFKNQIAYPLFVTVQRESNGICPVNFCNLPPELSLLILSKLDVRSLCNLGSTSQQFKELVNQPKLWRNLLFRDFGFKTSAASNWKQIYREQFRQARNRNRPSPCLRMPYPTRPDCRIGFPSGPLGHPFPFGGNIPGVIGGDYDLNPNFNVLEPRRRRFPFQPDVEFRRHFGHNGGSGFSFF